nr:hypothetical protein [Pantoea cypripedii]
MASSQTTEIKKVIILAGIGGIKMPWHNEDMNGIHETCAINRAAKAGSQAGINVCP